MKDDNLLLHPEDPFKPPPENMMLEDLNSGWWNRETWLEVCKQPDEILCPICFFIDGGKVTKRLSVEPVTFTLGILKRHVRNSVDAWRTLGYIEDSLRNSEVDGTDGATSSRCNSSAKLNDYHSILNVILSEFKILQGMDGGMEWDLNFQGKRHKVVFKFAVQVVLGDCKGNNSLCGQFGGHSLQSEKLCRDCMVSPMESDDPEHICTFVTLDDVKDKSKTDLKLMSMHKIDNVFHNIYFGARGSSIYNCTPPEPLHGVLLGTVKYLYEEFEQTVPKTTLSMINKFVRALYRNHSCQSEKEMPTLVSFQNGVNNCDVLTAKEQYSRLFAIFLSLHVSSVFKSFSTDKRKERVENPLSGSHIFQDKDPVGVATGRKWFLLLESSLTMYQWLMNDSHPPHTLRDQYDNEDETLVESRAQRAIRKYMHMYKDLVGQRSGHGLKITKFHQLLHYVRQIVKDGSIENIDTGICEGLAVSMYKKIAITTQKKQKTLNREIANRYLELLTCSEANRLSQRPLEESAIRRPVPSRTGRFKGTRYQLSFVEDNNGNGPSGNVDLCWFSKTNTIEFPPDLCICLANRLFLNTSDGGCLDHSSIVHGFTEYTDADGHIYRAHPNFRGKGEWFDWCLIQWEGIDELVPAKIITFLDFSSCHLMSEDELDELMNWLQEEGVPDVPNPINNRRISYLTKEKWVLIQSGMTAQEQGRSRSRQGRNQNTTTYMLSSEISSRFLLEENYRLLPVTSIASPAYCIPLNVIDKVSNDREYLHISQKDTWAGAFLPEV